jgi:hypothetical protein
MGSKRVGYGQLGMQFAATLANNEVLRNEWVENKGERKDRHGGMSIRSTSDIVPKGKDIRNSYLPPNWKDTRSIADITELGEIGLFMNRGYR